MRIKSVVNQQNARIVFVDNSRNDSLVNKCERIRREYRNKAAHIDIVTKRQAENCYRAVIGKIDAYDYNTNVTSALLELFSILKYYFVLFKTVRYFSGRDLNAETAGNRGRIQRTFC